MAQTSIVPILIITKYVMNSGLKERLLVLPSAIGYEPTWLTEKSGSLLGVVKESKKDHARTDID